eukprot:9159370-Pyramimonas_sp.AAC.1
MFGPRRLKSAPRALQRAPRQPKTARDGPFSAQATATTVSRLRWHWRVSCSIRSRVRAPVSGASRVGSPRKLRREVAVPSR